MSPEPILWMPPGNAVCNHPLLANVPRVEELRFESLALASHRSSGRASKLQHDRSLRMARHEALPCTTASFFSVIYSLTSIIGICFSKRGSTLLVHVKGKDSADIPHGRGLGIAILRLHDVKL